MFFQERNYQQVDYLLELNVKNWLISKNTTDLILTNEKNDTLILSKKDLFNHIKKDKYYEVGRGLYRIGFGHENIFFNETNRAKLYFLLKGSNPSSQNQYFYDTILNSSNYVRKIKFEEFYINKDVGIMRNRFKIFKDASLEIQLLFPDNLLTTYRIISITNGVAKLIYSDDCPYEELNDDKFKVIFISFDDLVASGNKYFWIC